MQVEESLPASEGVLSLLLARTGAALKALESDYGVRLRLDREAKSLGARGPAGGVLGVKAALKAAEATKAVIEVDTRVLPSVVGKGGANFKALREAGEWPGREDRQRTRCRP